MGFDIGVRLGLNLGPPGYAACPVELGAAPLAFRGLRLRSLLSLQLGTSVVRDPVTGLWRLEIEGEDVKTGRYISARLPELLGPWIDRYVAVERCELLGDRATDAFWVNWGGERLEEKGLDKRIHWQSAKRFGANRAFRTHRFRHCIGSTTPLLLPEVPGLAAALLRITGSVAERSYDRSAAVLAFRALHATLAAERKRTAPRRGLEVKADANLDAAQAAPLPSGALMETP
jgi:hypothetical protein